MRVHVEEGRGRTVLLGAIVACGIATAAPAVSAATFSARETHQGLVIDHANGTTGKLVANGWFRRPGEPALVYREAGVAVAGVWETGPGAAVVRSWTTEKAPVRGRIVPAWKDGALRVTIEPAGSAAVQTTARWTSSTGTSSTCARSVAERRPSRPRGRTRACSQWRTSIEPWTGAASKLSSRAPGGRSPVHAGLRVVAPLTAGTDCTSASGVRRW